MRKLRLAKETLAELTGAELDAVVGAQQGVTVNSCICSDFAQCIPSYRCPTDGCTTAVATLQGC